MKGLKVNLKDAQRAKKYLVDNELLDQDFILKKDKKFIVYPVRDELRGDAGFKYENVSSDFKEKKKAVADLRALLKAHLSEEEMDRLKTSQDIVGSIAILEIDAGLRKKEVLIAKALLKSNKSIKTVLRKDDKHTGRFRTQKMKFLAGIDTKETVHKESAVRLLLDVEEVYFSPRLSTDRKRIAGLVKKGESVLVMFSGCAPYPCVIAKNANPKKVVGVEINPKGHFYGLKNVEMNRLRNVELYEGDVFEVVPSLGSSFDRIVMAAPDNAEDFLDVALGARKDLSFVHLYAFCHEDDFDSFRKRIRSFVIRKGFSFEEVGLVKCGQRAPGVYRVCLDFKVKA